MFDARQLGGVTTLGLGPEALATAMLATVTLGAAGWAVNDAAVSGSNSSTRGVTKCSDK